VKEPQRSYPPISAWNFRLYFALLSALLSNWCVFASIAFVGKMSGFFATSGSVF
jgi:hypothetical protein